MYRKIGWAVILGIVAVLLSGCTGLLSYMGTNDVPDMRERSPSPTGQYIVVFQDRAIPAGARAEIVAAGGEVKTEFPQIGVLVAASADPDFPNRVASVPGVLDVGSDPFIQLPGDPDDRLVMLDPPPAEPVPVDAESMFAPLGLEDDIAANDLYVAYQWDIKRVGGDATTWAIEQGAGVTVAVLDTGVYATHPDIALNYAYGKSFVDITIPLPPGWQLWDGGGAEDYEGHGTHVAGSIAATMLNGRIIGVAPQASIANYKVMIAVLIPYEGDYYASGVGMSSWVIAGLMEAADDGVHVANLSLGGRGLFTDPEDLAWFIAYARATQYAWEKDVLVVSASGNDALDYSRGPWRNSPSMTPASLAISATGPDDSLAFYSSVGAFNADFTGPGGDISNIPFSFCLSSYSPRNAWEPGAGYVWSIGTSMAAPKVTGVAALIYAANPGITPTEVVRILEQTAEDLGKAGYDFQFGWGLAHAYRALTGSR